MINLDLESIEGCSLTAHKCTLRSYSAKTRKARNP